MPVGFQYSPFTRSWIDITMNPDYQWGDTFSSFIMFSPPGETVLLQVSTSQSNNATTNTGLLELTSDGSYDFRFQSNWTADPHVQGYPTRYGAGRDAIYQFGSVVTNDPTVPFKTALSRLPFASNDGNISAAGNISTFEIDEYSTCLPTRTVIRFYKDTLYVLCENGNMTISPGVQSSLALSDLFQVISGGENSSLWGYDTQGSISLDPRSLGNLTATASTVNIIDSYGDLNYLGPDEQSHIWPRWKKRIRLKVIAIVSRTDDDNGEDITSVGVNSSSKSEDALDAVNSTIHKIEDISMSKIHIDECYKILVTPDMDLNEIETTNIVVPIVVDAETGYIQNISLEYHPRPSIVTSMSEISNLNNERITETLMSSRNSNNSQNSLPQHLITLETTLPTSLTSQNIESSRHQEQQHLSGGLKAISIHDEDIEDYVPSYSRGLDLPIPNAPSFPAQVFPSAPPLLTDIESGSGSTEHASVISSLSDGAIQL
ncbi:hypothetical protein BGZ49_007603 [Haplosporangium sp. Z 27]|nr:hypothetical protein BGZ49_007603 [Haplosporangium sp. Z 27]